MIAAEGKGAVPAGTYKPTESSAWLSRSQWTPGIVCTDIGEGNCASWKQRTLLMARSIAAMEVAASSLSADRSSSSLTRNSLISTSSKRDVNSRIARSPPPRTCSMMPITASCLAASFITAGRRKAACRSSASRSDQRMKSRPMAMPTFSRRGAPAKSLPRRPLSFRASPKIRFHGRRHESRPCPAFLRGE